MTWLAADEDGLEYIYSTKPKRAHLNDRGIWENVFEGYFFKLPKGSIKKLIGKELTWNDEPVELKEG